MSTPDGIFVGPNTGFVGVKTSAPTQALDVQGNAVVSGYLSASNLGTYRNRIINGDMKMDQKNAGAAVVVGGSGNTAPTYSLGPDRWQVATGASSGQLVAQQVDLSAADRVATGSAFDKAVSLSAVPTNGLVAYLGFENSLADSVGLLTNPVATGTTVYSGLARVGDRSLDLTANTAGSSTTLSVGVTYEIPIQQIPLTFSLWANFASSSPSGFQTLFDLGSANNGNNVFGARIISNASNQLYFDMMINGANYYNSPDASTAITANTWTHICGVMTNSGQAILYINGVAIKFITIPRSGTITASDGSLANRVHIGFQNANSTSVTAFKGYIDDVRIYNRALSATEVQALARYVPIMPAPTSGLTARLEFDGALTDSAGLLTSPTMTGTAVYSTISKSGSRSLDVTANTGGATASTYATYSLTSLSLPCTISFWFNASVVGVTSVIVGFGIPSSWGTWLSASGTSISTNTYIGSSTGVTAITPSNTIAANTWYHLSVTYAASGPVSVYVNGVCQTVSASNLPASGNISAQTGATATQMRVGAEVNTGAWAFKGLIDDVRIYNTALTPSQVAGLYYSYANTGYVLYQQPIEGHNLTDLALGTTAAQPLTVSAWVKNNTSVAQQVGLALNNNAGLVAYLPFDGSATDVMGALVGPLTQGTITYSSSAKAGAQCIDFSANTAGGSASTFVTYNIPTWSMPLSISYWIRLSTLSGRQIIFGTGTTTDDGSRIIIETDGSINYAINIGTGYVTFTSPANTIQINQWYNVVFVMNYSAPFLVYINGNLISQSSTPIASSGVLSFGDSSSTGAAVTLLRLGARAGPSTTTASFNGLMDDFKIYNRAISAFEIAAIYNANASSTTATTLSMPRSVIYATPSIPANSWQRVAFTVPGDTVGYWTSNVTTNAFLSACLGAASMYSTSNMATASNNSSTVWNAIPEYTGSNIQIMGGSSNNILALPTGSILLTGVQLEKGNVATTYEVRGPEVESLLNAVVPVGTRLTDVPVDMMNYGNLQLSGNISAGNLGMFRNRIINGDMRIDQKGNGGSGYTVTSSAYTMDRWYCQIGAGTLSVTRNALTISDAPFSFGFKHSMKVASTISNGNYSEIGQRIESFNISDFNWSGNGRGSPIVLSFWFKAAVAGQYGYGIYHPSVQNDTFTGLFTVAAPNTWGYYSLVIPPPTSTVTNWNANTNGMGFEIMIGVDGGNSGLMPTNLGWANNVGNLFVPRGCYNWSSVVGNYIEFTGVQLEKGTIATPFEFRPYGIELQLCQRYYQSLTVALASGLNAANNFGIIGLQISPPMRDNPTLTGYFPNNGWAVGSTRTHWLQMYKSAAGNVEFGGASIILNAEL